MASGTIQKPNTFFAIQVDATLNSGAFAVIDDRFETGVCAVITPEYYNNVPLNLCCTASVLDGGIGNRRINVYVRTGSGSIPTGTYRFNIICGRFS